MDSNSVIRGAIGGGSSHTPIEQDDTLFSTAYIDGIFVLSNGPVKGIVGGGKGIYFDGTPLVDNSGHNIHPKVQWQFRHGTLTQDPIDDVSDVSAEATIDVKVVKDTPVVRTVNNPDADYAVVTLGFPRLVETKDNGDLVGTKVEFTIDIKPADGGWIPAYYSSKELAATYNGVRYVSPATAKSVSINLTALVGVDITVQHSTDDSSYSTLVVLEGIKGAGDVYEYHDTAVFDVVGTHYIKIIGTTTSAIVKFYSQEASIVVDGKTMSRYQEQYGIKLVGASPWDIRISRITDDSTSVKLANELWWDLLRTEVSVRLRYPYTAYIRIRFPANDFNSLPKIQILLAGMECRVPVNYDPKARTYTGVWNGTFKTVHTNNAAWTYYNLATNPIYGLAKWIDPATVDKWFLYQIAQYCDEMVDSGYRDDNGNIIYEPRFQTNVQISSPEDAYTMLNTLAAVFRGMVYVIGGMLTATADMPMLSVEGMFTNANIVGGQFNYSGSAKAARHTVAYVQYQNKNDLYNQTIEPVFDYDGIARYGYNPTTIKDLGCSRGQAHRAGKSVLLAERYLTDVVTFVVGFDSVFLQPMSAIYIADAFKMGRRFGGRLVAINGAEVTLDANVIMLQGSNYYFSIILADGSINIRQIITSPAATNILLLDSALDGDVVDYAIWTLAEDNGLQPTLWRVLSIDEDTPLRRFKITALQHSEAKFSEIDDIGAFDDNPLTSVIETTVAAVTNPVIEVIAQTAQNKLINNRLSLSWDSNPKATRYLVKHRQDGGNWQTTTTQTNEIQLAFDAGSYEFEIYAVNAFGYQSPVTKISGTVTGVESDPFTTTHVVASEAEMLALPLKKGDIVKRMDL